MPECPECGARLPKNPKAGCPECSWRPGAVRPSRMEEYRCQWETAGRRCRLIGQVARGDPMTATKHWYCDWHDVCRSRTGGAQWAETRHEWDAWREQIRRGGYCTDVVHLPADWQWAALRGLEPSGVPVRSGCDRGYPFCDYAARPAALGPRITDAREALAALKSLTARIGDPDGA